MVGSFGVCIIIINVDIDICIEYDIMLIVNNGPLGVDNNSRCKYDECVGYCLAVKVCHLIPVKKYEMQHM